MNWINLRVSDLRAPQFLGSDPLARATWLAVLAFCTDQENGGRIVGGARWTGRQWQAVCGVTSDEINQAAPLLTVEGEDVLVWNYPIEKEIEVRAKREQARSAAISRWSNGPKPTPPMREQCATHAPRMHRWNAEVEVERERKGKSVAGAREVGQLTPPPTHPPHFSSSRAPATPGAEAEGENDEAWLARIAKEWPHIDLDAEINAARRKNPTGFDRLWFENKWLPHSKPRIAAAPRPIFASAVKPPALPEPDGWRAELADSQFGPGGSFEARTWGEVPPDIQKIVSDRLHSQPAAHAD